MTDEEERQHQERMRQARLRRLRELEVQHATTGAHTRPEILTEIAQLRKELGIVEAALSSPVSASFLDELGEKGRYIALTYRIDMIDQKVNALGGAHEERRQEQARRIDEVREMIHNVEQGSLKRFYTSVIFLSLITFLFSVIVIILWIRL